MAYLFDSLVMKVSDRDVVQRLIAPQIWEKLGYSNVRVTDNGDMECATSDGVTETIKPAVRSENNIETRDYLFPSGRLCIQRDGIELLAEVFFAAKEGDKERKMLRCALRDRQLDGTKQSSALTAFPNTHEATNTLPHPDFKVAELSIYCYDPERYLPEGEMLDFILNVDSYIYTREFNPVEFFRLWKKAFEASNMAPWQPAPSIKGVAEHFVKSAGEVLTEVGYHRMDAVAGWYNVALFFIERMQFGFTYGEHYAAFQALEAALRKLEARIGRRLNKREQAWVVALQNIPAEFIPEAVRLGYRWLNTPTYTDYVCRLHKDLNVFPKDARLDSLDLPNLLKARAPTAVATDAGAMSTEASDSKSESTAAAPPSSEELPTAEHPDG